MAPIGHYLHLTHSLCNTQHIIIKVQNPIYILCFAIRFIVIYEIKKEKYSFLCKFPIFSFIRFLKFTFFNHELLMYKLGDEIYGNTKNMYLHVGMKVCRIVDDMFREFVGGGNYVNIKVHYTRKFCILFFLKKAVRNITLGINQT